MAIRQLRRLFYLSILLSSYLLTGCAGTPSSGPASVAAVQPAPSPEELPDPGFDPALNRLVHQGWIVSMPPGWIAEADHSGEDAFIFRLSGNGSAVLSLNRIAFNFMVDRDRLISFIEETLGSQGTIANREEIDISLPGRRGTAVLWQLEHEEGGIHRVILEENSQGFYEWRLSTFIKENPLNDDILMRIFREAEMTADRSVSRRKRDTGFWFSSQGGPWCWTGDFEDGFLLLYRRAEEEVLSSLTVFHSRGRLLAWEDEFESKATLRSVHEYSFMGQPIQTRVSMKTGSAKQTTALFHYGETDPVTIFLQRSHNRNRDDELDLFLRGDDLRSLLEFSLILPGRSK